MSRASAVADELHRQIYREKVSVPRLGRDLLLRARVSDLIERCVERRVTTVTGPAGTGKTVACAMWANGGTQERRVAWLTLDEGDRDPAHFWAHLRAALHATAVPPGAAGAERGSSTGSEVPPRRADAGDPAASMAEAVRGVTGPVVLILDDAHEVGLGDASHGLNFLLRHAPPALRIVVCGRTLEGLHVARMRVAGELAEIAAAELACTPAEAGRYLATLGVQLEEEERTALLRYTGGWMAGMKLAALAVERSGRSSPGLEAYLRDEFLDVLPEADRLFLLRTSVTRKVTGDLAGWLTGMPGGAAAMERLSQESGFVERVHGGYRYRPVLRDALLAQARREMPDELPALLRRAAAWHAAHGQPVEAVRCVIEAGDWDSASRILAEGGYFAELPRRAGELETLLARFPSDRRAADSGVSGAFAAVRLYQGDPDTAAVYLDCAEQVLGAQADGEGLPALLAALRIAVPGSDSVALEHGRQLAAAAPATAAPAAQAGLGLLWFALGTAAMRNWDIPAARRAFVHAERRLAIGLPELLSRARGWRSLAEALAGELAAADRIVSEPGDPGSSCLRTLAAAQLALERDDLPSATAFADRADTTAVEWLPGEPDMNAVRTLLRTRIAIAAGDTSRDVPRSSQAERILARARLLLMNADAGGALTMVEQLLTEGADVTTRERITAGVFAAVAHHSLGDDPAAAALLETGLAQAEPNAAYRPFLDGGTPVRSAISVLVPPGSPVAGFAARVLARFVCQLPEAGQAPGRARAHRE
jgi:LuxR family maltose regulon positive regulatory protein